MKLSIVIPIYNESENIQHLYQCLQEAQATWTMIETCEVIYVDDGSSDDSVALLESLLGQSPQVKILKLSRNFGHQAAITAGLQYAKGDAVVIMDGDLQDPPEVILQFLETWQQGYEVVYAIRQKRKEIFIKRWAYYLFYRLLKRISHIDIPLDAGDFCLMDSKLVHILNREMPEQNRFVRGLRAYAGFRQKGITYERAQRAAGEAKYTYSKLVGLALDGLLNFSTLPLRLAVYLGFFIAGSSFLVGIFFIVHRIFNFKLFGYSPTDTPGLATLVVGIFFSSGIILMVLGIMGEYIGRIYMEIKRRPMYIVNEVITHKKKGKNDLPDQ